MSQYLQADPRLESFWRAVVLFGRNVASYKFALAKSLIQLSANDKTTISLEELAERFSLNIVEHLAHAPKQATSASSRFLDAAGGSATATLSRRNSSEGQ